MKCELCHQQEAETVLYRPGKQGRDEELYVCKACAEKEEVFGETHGIQVAAMGAEMPPMGDLGAPPSPEEMLNDLAGGDAMNFPPRELLGKLGEVFGQLSEKLGELDAQGNERCPKCGMTFEEVRTEGVLGCSNCLKVFRKAVLRLIQELQGATEYVGEPAVHFETKALKKKLAAELKAALAREDYVAAKALKAQLAALENEEGQDRA